MGSTREEELAALKRVAPFRAHLSTQEWDALADVAFGPIPASAPMPAAPAPGGEPLPAGAPAVIGIAGAPRSGKDTIADYLIGRYAGVARIAFSDVIITEANALLGPFGRRIDHANKSTPAYRLVLQTVSVARRREDEDYWSYRLIGEVTDAREAGARCVVLTGVRTASDARLVRDLGGVLWRVVRAGHTPAGAAHPIEQMLDGWPDAAFDGVLHNEVEGDPTPMFPLVDRLLAGQAIA